MRSLRPHRENKHDPSDAAGSPAGDEGGRRRPWSFSTDSGTDDVIIGGDDLIDLIDGERDSGTGGEATEGGTDSDDDAHSCCSLDSDASGPSLPRHPAPPLERGAPSGPSLPRHPAPPLERGAPSGPSLPRRPVGRPAPPLERAAPSGLCPGCQRLYREAGRRRTPTAVIDNDPSSLACDQWVLKKEWRPKRPRNIKGSLWAHLSRIRKRSQKEKEEGGEDGERPACWRPLLFLQRNLRRCAGQAAGGKRKRVQRRKRGGKGRFVAKRLRLHDNPVPQDDGRRADPTTHDDDNSSSSSDDTLVFRVIPTLVTMETPAAQPKQEVLRRRGARDFKDLLAQLRGNRGSIIIRETHA